MNLLIGDVERICKSAISSNHYIRMRYQDGVAVGFNPKIVNFKSLDLDRKKQSRFVSYRFISFQEYISTKVPFINEPKRRNQLRADHRRNSKEVHAFR